ncbi:MAG: efflux RND transporter permease subunit, partial [Campylobacterales bacterium]|nr:efflux RND transporter permease subunit [Campylobacterales bacterium]
DDIANRIRRENIDTSAGILDIDRRSYRIRTTAKFNHSKDIEEIVLYSDGLSTIKIKDVATVKYDYENKQSVAMFLGKAGIVVGVKAKPDANIVNLTNAVEKVVNNLNKTILKDEKLYMKWFYDQRKYINGSIDLVQQNIVAGAILAIFVLYVFLRSMSSTMIIFITIPISVISTFIAFLYLDRSINTISLAGISFAVGMLIDNAIVVLENIDRHRQMGKHFIKAAYEGTKEVWGALIASSLTNIAVFLPIIFMKNEAGQLFKDIAIAATASVAFSMFVSIFVIPSLYSQIVRFSKQKKSGTIAEKKESSYTLIGRKINDTIIYFVDLSIKNVFTRVMTVLSLVAFSCVSVYMFFPKLDYLPQGNRNLVFNILIPPPGLSYEENKKVGAILTEKFLPYTKEAKDGYPQIDRLFFLASGSFVIMGVTSKDEERAGELVPLFQPFINSIPGFYGVSKQVGVFETGLGKSKVVDVDVSGDDLDKIIQASGVLFGAIKNEFVGSQIRPVPSIELLFNEVRVIPDGEKLNNVGMNSQSLGVAIDVLMDGRKISEFKEDGKNKIDLILKSPKSYHENVEELHKLQIATPTGDLVSLGMVSKLEYTTTITEIRRLNGVRTITLQVTPPKDMTIQEAMTKLENEILPKLQNAMPKGIDISLKGTASKLINTISDMKLNLLLAVLIIYLLMVALYENFIYPLIILVTLPLGAAGGFIGLELTNRFIAYQPLDVLTMFGFIILVGTVVNNAILIVHQSLNLIRFENYNYHDAILEGTRSRLRPIFMTAFTSVFGMLPLVLVPGPGSEFYRGLGSVITGGLLVSTVFTIFVIPALLSFVIKMEKLRDTKVKL